MWRWLIDHWAWANGETILRLGRPLLSLTLRELTDVGFRLYADWLAMDAHQMKAYETLRDYFHDKEREFETGELVLPDWASVGNVAAQYGDDGADPFAALEA